MASTDQPTGGSRLSGNSPWQATEYLVPDWVQVRRESFGLLFYDARSTRLTFVRSGDMLAPPPFTGARRLLGVCSVEGERRPALKRVLQKLAAKGLIVAVEAE